jgi:hypothetical protein
MRGENPYQNHLAHGLVFVRGRPVDSAAEDRAAGFVFLSNASSTRVARLSTTAEDKAARRRGRLHLVRGAVIANAAQDELAAREGWARQRAEPPVTQAQTGLGPKRPRRVINCGTATTAVLDVCVLGERTR